MATLPRRLARAAGLLAGLILLGIAALHHPAIRARVLERARVYAERELHVALHASSLRYNLLTRSIELRDVSIASTSAADPLLQAERADVVLGRGILLGRPAITSVTLTRPRVTLVRDRNGAMNLPPSQTTAGSSSPLNLGVVSLTGLTISVDDRLAQRSVTWGPVDLSVDTAGAAHPFGAFGPSAFTARAGQTTLSGTLAGRLAFDGTRVNVQDAVIETREGRIELAGWMDVTGERPAVSARVKAAIDLARAPRLANLEERVARGLAGHLDGTIDVTGSLAAPEIALTVASRGASYAPVGPFRLNGRSSLSGSRAVIDGLDLGLASGSLHAQGAIELDDTTANARQSQVTLRWSNVEIDDLVKTAGYSPPVRSGSRANGAATIEFRTRDVEARAWSRLHVTATTTLNPVSTGTSPDLLSLAGRADLTLGEGRWTLRHSIQTRRAGADLIGDLTGTVAPGPVLQSTLGGRTRIRVADAGDLASLLQAAGVALPAEAVDGLAGSMTATLDLAGTTDSPRARIDLTARDMRARVWPHATVIGAQLDVDANGVNARDVQADSETTSLHGTGRYSWRGPYEGRVELSQGDLAAIASQFQLPVTVGGSARMEATIAAGHAVVSLSARDLVVDQVPIGPLTANGRLALVDNGSMTIDASAPAVGARAQLEIVNRAGYPVSGNVTLENNRIAALIPPRYLQQAGDLTGAVSLTATGAGRLSEPAGIRGRVDLRSLDVTARGTRVLLAAPGSITVEDDRLAADGIELRIGQKTRATLNGQLGRTVLPQPLRVHIESPLAEWVAVRGDAMATLDATVGGTVSHPLPNGTLAVHASSLEYGSLAPVTDLRLDGTIDPAVITVPSFTALWRGATLAGSATVPWRTVLSSLQSTTLASWLNALPPEPARATLALHADNVTQAVLTDLLAPERLEMIQGNASATIAADADGLSLDRVRATAVLDRASLVLAGVPVQQSVPTRLRLENGRASIDAFRWNAGAETIAVTGGADLMAARPSIDAAVSGVVDLRIVSAFVTGVSSAGTANADIKITGPADDPEIVGRIAVADGELQLDTPRFAASDLTGTIQIAAGRQAVVSLAGLLNAGRARLEGSVDLRDLALPRGNLSFTGRRVALEFPSGLQTESNADLTLALAGASSTLSGRIDVLGGTYREALVLSSQLLSLSSTSGIARAAPPSDWLTRMKLDVAVTTSEDVHVDNNYGRLDIGAALRIVGTPANPGVLGRLQAAEDGEIYVGGNTYRIERLAIDLTSPNSIAPEVNFAAQTRVGDMPIGIELTCPASGACERKVTALNGGDDKEAEARLLGSAADAASAGQSLARLLSGEVLGVVGRTVGLDTVRLEQEAQRRDIFDDPTLISGDVDPAARLTLGKRLGSGVELVYSQNLADSGFTWVTNYTGPHGLSARVLILDDNSRSYEFRHEPIGGGRTRQRSRPPGPRIAAVSITGTPGFTEKELRRHLGLGEGDRFTFGAWQRDRDRLARFYQAQAFLEARISARRRPADRDGQVVLEYAIARGAATRTIVRGATLPDAVRDRIERRWTTALFDAFLEKDAKTIVREHLYRQGFMNAAVTAAVALDAAGETKTLTIDVKSGSIVPRRITLTGNAVVSADQLMKVLGTSDPVAAWLDPHAVELLLEDHYRSEGLLAADVSVSAPAMNGGTSVVTISVAEGTAYSIGDVTLNGLPDESRQKARESLALSSGDRYQPARVAEGVNRVEAGLRQMAYRQPRVDVETRVFPETARVDVTVAVTPGPRSILRDVVVDGDSAKKALVARSIVLAPGAPLDPAAINETRRRLYGLDVYRSVDIVVQPVEASPAEAAGATGDEPVTARIAVEKRPRYRLRYGIAISDEEVGTDERSQELGFAADLENRNLFGRGATAGASVRLRRDQQVGRVSLGAKRLFALPIRSTVFIERQREQLDPDGAFPITTDISQLTLEQGYRARPWIDLRYGYSTEKNHTFIRSDQTDPFDITVRIARFTTGGLADRRNDAFNPTRGWFTASTLELSTPGIGSDLKFLKDFSQYSHFVPLKRGMVLASGARLGLARTFDDEVLIPSERFYAGGANSVRGYREDSLGAESVLGGPEGGSALLVLNGELRFPIYRWLKGVGFLDAGNVYPGVRDISFTKLQVGIGAGARLDTPFGLIRFDVGVPANPRPIDARWRFHFGFGHSF